MQHDDFPAIYRSADDLSRGSQANFFFSLRLHLILLVVAATLSVINITHWLFAVLQCLSLLGALFCSIYLFSKRPDRYWYAGRAVAESIKTTTWRYVCRAEPFLAVGAISDNDFRHKLKEIVDQNREVASALMTHLDARQVTTAMSEMRKSSLADRQRTYSSGRIEDQLSWYAQKAVYNKSMSNNFFWLLVTVNSFAVVLAVLRIEFEAVPIWPTDIFIALAASVLAWMQAKRFSELAASYALTAHEIGLIREQAFLSESDEDFSKFVGDAENAFSREHTQWVARKDV